MTPRYCAREREVLRAVGRDWLGHADASVAEHLAACERCTEVRAAAEILRAGHLRDAQAARVPSGAAMWWRIERRRRDERARRAQRIASALQAVMLAAAAGGAAAVLQFASPWLQSSAGAAADSWRTMAAVLVTWSQAGAAWTLPVALAVSAWLLLLPAAVYFGFADE